MDIRDIIRHKQKPGGGWPYTGPKGPENRYITSDSLHLGPVKFASDDLGQFLENYMKGTESLKIPIKNFLSSEHVDTTMLDSLLDNISNTVFATYSDVGKYQYNDEGEEKKLQGKFNPFDPEANPEISNGKDTVFVHNKLFRNNLFKTLFHELMHKYATHEEDYEEDRPVYEEFEKEIIKPLTVGDRSNIIKLLYPDGFQQKTLSP